MKQTLHVCGNCQYWNGETFAEINANKKPGGRFEPQNGLCTREPPKAIVIPMQQQKIAGINGHSAPEIQLQPYFVPSLETWSCGEHHAIAAARVIAVRDGRDVA